MKSRDYVKITKISKTPDFKIDSASMDEHVPGSPNDHNKSLPVDYWITGNLVGPVEEGAPVRAIRDCRNGISAFGLFCTSPIKSIKDVASDGSRILAHTENSIYQIELTEQSPD